MVSDTVAEFMRARATRDEEQRRGLPDTRQRFSSARAADVLIANVFALPCVVSNVALQTSTGAFQTWSRYTNAVSSDDVAPVTPGPTDPDAQPVTPYPDAGDDNGGNPVTDTGDTGFSEEDE